jgi:hypothetical protein
MRPSVRSGEAPPHPVRAGRNAAISRRSEHNDEGRPEGPPTSPFPAAKKKRSTRPSEDPECSASLRTCSTHAPTDGRVSTPPMTSSTSSGTTTSTVRTVTADDLAAQRSSWRFRDFALRLRHSGENSYARLMGATPTSTP